MEGGKIGIGSLSRTRYKSLHAILRGYLHETGTNLDQEELVPIRNSCSRLRETETKCLVDYMRPV